MNQTAKDTWIELLLSGRYRQLRDALHKTWYASFSTSGLLCEAHRLLTGAGRWGFLGTMGESFYIVGDELDDWYLPDAVWEWAGLPDRNDGNAMPINIITLNATMEFPEIADQIERHL